MARRNPSGTPPKADPRSEQLLDVSEMAAYIRKTEDAIYKMVERRQIPCVKLGQALRFDPVAIQAWIKEHSIPSTEPPAFLRCSRRDGQV